MDEDEQQAGARLRPRRGEPYRLRRFCMRFEAAGDIRAASPEESERRLLALVAAHDTSQPLQEQRTAALAPWLAPVHEALSAELRYAEHAGHDVGGDARRHACDSLLARIQRSIAASDARRSTDAGVPRIKPTITCGRSAAMDMAMGTRSTGSAGTIRGMNTMTHLGGVIYCGTV